MSLLSQLRPGASLPKRQTTLILLITLLATLVSVSHSADYYYTYGGKAFTAVSDCLNPADPCDNTNNYATWEFPAGSQVHHIQTNQNFFNTNSSGLLIHQFANPIAASISFALTAFPAILKDAIVTSTFIMNAGDQVIFDNLTTNGNPSWQIAQSTSNSQILVQNSTFYAAMPFPLSVSASLTFVDCTIYDTAYLSPPYTIYNLTFNRVNVLSAGGSTIIFDAFATNLTIVDCYFELNNLLQPQFKTVMHSLILRTTMVCTGYFTNFCIGSAAGVAKKDAEGAQAQATFIQGSTFDVKDSNLTGVFLTDITASYPIQFSYINYTNNNFYNSRIYIQSYNDAVLQNNVINSIDDSESYGYDSLVTVAVENLYITNNTFPDYLYNYIAAIKFDMGLAPLVTDQDIYGDFDLGDILMNPNTGTLTVHAHGYFAFHYMMNANSGNGGSVWNTTGVGSTLVFEDNVYFPGTQLDITCSNGGKTRIVYSGFNHSLDISTSGSTAFTFQAGDLEFAIPRPAATLPVLLPGMEFTIVSPIPAYSTFPAYHFSDVLGLGYEGDFYTTSNAVVFNVTKTFCAQTCQNGGMCIGRDLCNCTTGWSGPTCACSTVGQFGNISCSTSGSQDWVVAGDLQTGANDHLDLPPGYNLIVQGALNNNGTITIGPGSSLQSGPLTNGGVIQVQGGIVPSSKRDGTCKSSASLSVSNFTLPASGRVNVNVDTTGVDPDSPCAQELTAPIIASNTTSQLDGTISVNVAGSSSTRASIAVVSSGDRSGSTTSSSLAVTSTTPSGTCSTTDKQPGLVSLFVSPCSTKKSGVKWYYWGAPIIAVVGVVVIFLIIAMSVPKIRHKILPYKGSNV